MITLIIGLGGIALGIFGYRSYSQSNLKGALAGDWLWIDGKAYRVVPADTSPEKL